MQKKRLMILSLALPWVFNSVPAYAQTSKHTVSVDRIFSARPRSMSYRYVVTITCQDAGENILQQPVKNSSFGWRIGGQINTSTTDSNGRAEFTQTSFDGKLAEVLELVYKDKTMIFTAAQGLQTIPVEQRCR
ncbi:hypothetical protein B9G69_013050 [Bdellovibrio sp. SKB1291214]|uniref:hypothetical protein n=1 Tax=Bdellovibrio sp. SKB1291214 TaxID=1732569 RepID=UPI000B515C3A|nr:hypothetical protein [Bdellovibrio sp. SKB1291214]UYL07973.1 hypothetical protein B9G69_013050 [Bdellovibrio sp. SKB1291214]